MLPAPHVCPPLLRVASDARTAAARVYVDSHNLAWHCLCNLTDASTGVTKFYRMQLLQTGSSYAVYRAWGRGGGAGEARRGDMLLRDHGHDLEAALKEFRDKFSVLTRDNFETCVPPSQLPGAYAIALIPVTLTLIRSLPLHLYPYP